MRPIDADALKELLLKERDAIPKTVTAPYYEFSVQKPNHTGDLVRGGIKKALRCMENTPTLTIDEIRPKGEWIWIDGDPYCNHCGCTPAYWEAKPRNEKGLPPYCHSCGRKMKGCGE